MDEPRSILERAAERASPSEAPREGALPRRARTNRNRRITAGVIGLTIGLVAILLGANTFRSSPKVPADYRKAVDVIPSSPNVAADHKTDPVMGNGPITVFGFLEGLRSLSLDGRQERSLVRCQRACLVFSAAWSPDGSRVAFSTTCPGGCGSAGHPYQGIRVVDLATGDHSFVVRHGSSPSPSLDWSPDGSQISYVADGSIHLMDADGTNRTAIPGQSGAAITASWSPDGTRFAYTSGGAISVIGVDGADWALIATSTQSGLLSPVWSPDGEEIAYRRGCDVWVTTPDGAHRTRLAELRSTISDGHCEFNRSPASGPSLAWSPDGQQIAVLVDGMYRQRVVLMQADGSNVRVLSLKRSFRSYGLAWQPMPSGA